MLYLLIVLKKLQKIKHTFCSTSEYPSWRLISHVVSSHLKNLTKSLRLSANIRKHLIHLWQKRLLSVLYQLMHEGCFVWFTY